VANVRATAGDASVVFALERGEEEGRGMVGAFFFNIHEKKNRPAFVRVNYSSI
jgi:hypothetical protein